MAGTSVGEWTGKIVGFAVLIIIVAALYGGILRTSLANYAANETTFGPTVELLVPILLGVGILFVGLEVFMPGALGHAFGRMR
jgi:hypothetical protein